MRLGILLFVIVFAVSGCSINTNINISEIKDRPDEYKGKQVSIKGKVIETVSVPLIHKGAYQVDDGTGKIWVMSQERIPYRGDDVKIKGEVKTGFTFHKLTLGTVIVEGEKEK